MQIGHQTQLETEAEIILMWLIFSPHFSEKAILIHSNEKLKNFLKKKKHNNYELKHVPESSRKERWMG